MKTINVKNPRYRVYAGPGGYNAENVIITSRKADHEIGFYDITIEKGKKSSAHYHAKQDEILYFLQPAKVTFKGKVYLVKPKTIIFANAGDEHMVETLSKSTRYIAMRFPFYGTDKKLVISYSTFFGSKKVIIFDIDGTLVDSMDAHTQAYAKVLHDFCGISVRKAEDITKHYGIQNHETFKRIHDDYGVPYTDELIDKLVQARADKLASAVINQKSILPGVLSLLKKLKSEGKIIAVITGNSRRVGETILQRTKLKRYFSVCVFGDDVYRRNKLNGRHEMIALALHKVEAGNHQKYSKKEVLVVGDMIPDIQGAQRAGFDSLAVATGGIPLEELQKHHPTFGVKSFMEIM